MNASMTFSGSAPAASARNLFEYSAAWPGADDEDVCGGHRPMVPRGEDLGDPRV
jgi:hypothetical protein